MLFAGHLFVLVNTCYSGRWIQAVADDFASAKPKWNRVHVQSSGDPNDPVPNDDFVEWFIRYLRNQIGADDFVAILRSRSSPMCFSPASYSTNSSGSGGSNASAQLISSKGLPLLFNHGTWHVRLRLRVCSLIRTCA